MLSFVQIGKRKVNMSKELLEHPLFLDGGSDSVHVLLIWTPSCTAFCSVLPTVHGGCKYQQLMLNFNWLLGVKILLNSVVI